MLNSQFHCCHFSQSIFFFFAPSKSRFNIMWHVKPPKANVKANAQHGPTRKRTSASCEMIIKWMCCTDVFDVALKCNWAEHDANKPQLEVCACVSMCVCVGRGNDTLPPLRALSHWPDGRREKKVTFPDIICHEQSRRHMAKSERPSMPIIEYISFGLDEALEALQTQHVHTLLQLEN